MRRLLKAALFVLAVAAGCNNFHYDEGKGYFVNDPEYYSSGPPSGKHR